MALVKKNAARTGNPNAEECHCHHRLLEPVAPVVWRTHKAKSAWKAPSQPTIYSKGAEGREKKKKNQGMAGHSTVPEDRVPPDNFTQDAGN